MHCIETQTFLFLSPFLIINIIKRHLLVFVIHLFATVWSVVVVVVDCEDCVWRFFCAIKEIIGNKLRCAWNYSFLCVTTIRRVNHWRTKIKVDIFYFCAFLVCFYLRAILLQFLFLLVHIIFVSKKLSFDFGKFVFIRNAALWQR